MYFFTMSSQDYTKLEKIGEGTYGVVYKGINKKTGSLVAMKKIKNDIENEGLPATAIREVSLLRELQHPNIVELLQATLEGEMLYLIFEFITMDLRKYLDKGLTMDPNLVKSYMYQINEAILFCHQRRILHRDLKPQNLLISSDGTIKVADFGLGRAVMVPLRKYTHEVVTLWYRAPEVLMGCDVYTYSIDIWSFACIFAEMLTSRPLFQGDSEIDQLFQIFRVLKTPTEEMWPEVVNLPHYQVNFPKWCEVLLIEQFNAICLNGFKLLEQMLIYKPQDRISAKRIRDHQYFKNVDTTVKPNFD